MSEILILAIGGAIGLIIGSIGIWLLQQRGKLLPPIPMEKRIATLAISARIGLRAGGIYQKFVRVTNISSFAAKTIKIMSQECLGQLWRTPPTDIQIYKSGDQVRQPIEELKPSHDFEILLDEGLAFFLLSEVVDEGKETYFAVRVEWENPNRSVGCLFRYIKVTGVSTETQTGTMVFSPEIIVVNERPQGILHPDIPPCPS
ncbi:hypothetical protein MYX64_07875 [Nitrospinae bacterium AH_259_B05_G02_I21]|nr:hypothetical protein [Nitrospinae bacterium AH_259_B05_G02_I21]MDA2932200.1 hypothetical protein [Nitrospinae bacterium AH-259-F20]